MSLVMRQMLATVELLDTLSSRTVILQRLSFKQETVIQVTWFVRNQQKLLLYNKLNFPYVSYNAQKQQYSGVYNC